MDFEGTPPTPTTSFTPSQTCRTFLTIMPIKRRNSLTLRHFFSTIEIQGNSVVSSAAVVVKNTAPNTNSNFLKDVNTQKLCFSSKFLLYLNLPWFMAPQESQIVCVKRKTLFVVVFVPVVVVVVIVWFPLRKQNNWRNLCFTKDRFFSSKNVKYFLLSFWKEVSFSWISFSFL